MQHIVLSAYCCCRFHVVLAQPWTKFLNSFTCLLGRDLRWLRWCLFLSDLLFLYRSAALVWIGFGKNRSFLCVFLFGFLHSLQRSWYCACNLLRILLTALTVYLLGGLADNGLKSLFLGRWAISFVFMLPFTPFCFLFPAVTTLLGRLFSNWRHFLCNLLVELFQEVRTGEASLANIWGAVWK